MSLPLLPSILLYLPSFTSSIPLVSFLCLGSSAGAPSSSTLVSGTMSPDYEVQEDWDEDSQTPPSEPYPYEYPAASKVGSSDEEEEEEEEEPLYEPVSVVIETCLVFLGYMC